MTSICNHEKCKKKIDMMPFTCKCGKKFCIKHKNPQSHCCSYDYKNHMKQNLEISLVKAIKRKVEEI